MSCKNTALSSRSKTVADQGDKNTESVGLSRTTYEEADCTNREHDPTVEKTVVDKEIKSATGFVRNHPLLTKSSRRPSSRIRTD